MASSIVECPRMLPAYASIECDPFKSQSLRCSNGSTSATSATPASSQRGRPAGNPPETTHSLKGSVATGYASRYPQACCTNARSSSVVPGVIRSTIEVAKSTWVSIQSGSVSRSEEHTSELQSLAYLVCRLLLE